MLRTGAQPLAAKSFRAAASTPCSSLLGRSRVSVFSWAAYL